MSKMLERMKIILEKEAKPEIGKQFHAKFEDMELIEIANQFIYSPVSARATIIGALHLGYKAGLMEVIELLEEELSDGSDKQQLISMVRNLPLVAHESVAQ